MIKTNISTQTPNHAPYIPIILATLLLLCPTTTHAETSGDYEYTPYGDGTCTITSYIGLGGEITIPDTLDGLTVTTIGSSAFSNCYYITGLLTISDNVETIEDYAFYSCSSLTAVMIGNSVITIGENAFSYCYGLSSSLTIPDNVVDIRDEAFYCCINLPDVNIGTGVTMIGIRAFASCSIMSAINVALANPNYSSSEGILFNKIQTELIQYPKGKSGAYKIPDNVIAVGDSAFYFCSGLTDINIPNSVSIIDDNAFYKCTALSNLTLGSSVTIIGNSAFSKCSDLTGTLIIPDSVTNIRDEAFMYCYNLTDINIGTGLTMIGIRAFASCSRLVNINVDLDNPLYSSLQGVLFNKSQTELICCPKGKSGSYLVPGSVTTIADAAFLECTKLTGVTLNSSLITIGNDAFSGCNNLAGSLMIPDSVTTVGDRAFYKCSDLTGLTIGNSVTAIGNSAFYGCSRLAGVLIIPESVISIGQCSFAYCSNMTEITVVPTNPSYTSLQGVLFNKTLTELIQCPVAKTGSFIIPESVTTIGSRAFSLCENLLSTLTIPESVITIGDLAFRSCTAIDGTLIIPDSVTTIGDFAFSNCQKLTTVTIGNSVTSIGESAFSNCKSLTGDLVIPESVISIEKKAFSFCIGLASVTIGDGTVTIGDSAFSDCTNLTDLTIGNNVMTIGSLAFNYCSSLTGTLTIPDSVTVINFGAFEGCYDLTGLNMGNNVTIIDNEAFLYCESLEGVLTIPDSVTTIGKNAFNRCEKLTGVFIGSGLFNLRTFFSRCSNMTNIWVDSNNPFYSSREGVLFNKNQTILLCYPEGKTGSYRIPDSVSTILGGAFSNCLGLNAVAIGKNVTGIYGSAFINCPELTSIYFKGDAPTLGAYVFRYTYATVYYLPRTSGWGPTFGGLATAVWPLSPADVDADYDVNLYDLSVFAAHWGQNGCNELDNWCDWADFDQSGAVDPNDLILLSDDWLYGIMPF